MSLERDQDIQRWDKTSKRIAAVMHDFKQREMDGLYLQPKDRHDCGIWKKLIWLAFDLTATGAIIPEVLEMLMVMFERWRDVQVLLMMQDREKNVTKINPPEPGGKSLAQIDETKIKS